MSTPRIMITIIVTTVVRGTLAFKRSVTRFNSRRGGFSIESFPILMSWINCSSFALSPPNPLYHQIVLLIEQLVLICPSSTTTCLWQNIYDTLDSLYNFFLLNDENVLMTDKVYKSLTTRVPNPYYANILI